ncbi:hypothetical protein IC229_11505 [Spirosoma sp. BT702]|uniref:Uncharacterized protein n=1 Tax=Spirosoma profusum TaxID=2771354 RepID=A0A926XWK0_9BACT|nr:hypothetical protein [Spirosoma profusum]MBD2701266.1 hypothetical protein [Spirosoma profusum]
MNIETTKHGKTSTYVNWLTIWGFVFGCIAFNLYFDNRQTRLAKTEYQTQYKLESQRADSLYKETVRLEQRLQEIKSTSGDKVSTRHSSVARQESAQNEL